MFNKIVERFLLWIMPLSPLETLIMMLLNGGWLQYGQYIRAKTLIVKMIIKNDHSVLSDLPDSYKSIKDKERLIVHPFSWAKKRQTAFKISLKILIIFSIHFKSKRKVAYSFLDNRKNSIKIENIIDIFYVTLLEAVLYNEVSIFIVHPKDLKDVLKFKTFTDFVLKSASSLITFDQKYFLGTKYTAKYFYDNINTILHETRNIFYEKISSLIDEETVYRVRNSQEQYFDVLGISPTNDISIIKSAYRALASRYHPDRNPNSGDKMQQINAAYSALKKNLNF